MQDVERMSHVDTSWLRMDNDVNLMMIVGVWVLSPAISLQALRRCIGSRLLRYPRFKHKVVMDALGPSWVTDEAFDLQHHVSSLRLPSPAGQSQRQALQHLCGDLAAQALDPDRPLWQFHLIEDYEGGAAVVARVHHCIGDGISLMSVMLGITDEGPALLKQSLALARARCAAPEPGSAGAVSPQPHDPLPHGHQPPPSPPPPHPQLMLGGVALARSGLQLVSDVAALALMPDDSPTLLKGLPAGRKAVAWSEPLALDEVKAVGKALGCTVNDVLLACVAGAIGSYLASRGQDPSDREIRAMVPVNLRPPGEEAQLGNKFGLVPLVLPIGIANPVERVFAVRQRMDQLKHSYQPLLAFAVLSVAGYFNKPVQDAVLSLFSSKATAVMTNVPGPTQPLKICGSTLRQTMFWVPASGHIGVGVSVLSYAGGVQFSLMTDQALCPDPQDIVERFEPEFDKLIWLALMLPWPGRDEDPEQALVAQALAQGVSRSTDLAQMLR